MANSAVTHGHANATLTGNVTCQDHSLHSRYVFLYAKDIGAISRVVCLLQADVSFPKFMFAGIPQPHPQATPECIA